MGIFTSIMESYKEAPDFAEHIKRKVWESAMGWKYGFDAASIKAGQAVQVLKREHEETVIGLSYGAFLAGEKAKEAVGSTQKGIEKSLAGWSMGISHVGGKVSESFGNLGGGLSSFKYPLYLLLAVFLFIAIMVAIGYSGVGGPTARIAEREYARRR